MELTQQEVQVVSTVLMRNKDGGAQTFPVKDLPVAIRIRKRMMDFLDEKGAIVETPEMTFDKAERALISNLIEAREWNIMMGEHALLFLGKLKHMKEARTSKKKTKATTEKKKS